ncbi:MAG: glucokinase [Betaproteobacteria bacterium]|nr:glucokinase [Betaproteobacteria bacterium]MDE2479004.1 glucokinase [Betaproteobacteria bacterium]
MMPTPLPHLLADIGGTNARFALEQDGRIGEIRVLACADYPSLQEAMRAYLRTSSTEVRHAAIGIANPVYTDRVRMTNHHWEFSIEALRREMGLETFLVMNDFAALALSLPFLPEQELRRVGGGQAEPRAARGVVGAGTGLGVGALVASADGSWQAVAGEGGHVSFSPVDEEEVDLWRFAHARYGHVSAERLLQGRGLELIHEWVCASSRQPGAPLPAARITELGLGGADAACRRSLELYCRILGTVAANVALTVDARGGLYIGGGIVPRLGDFLEQSSFRARFEDKGRLSVLLARIPVLVIHSPWPALIGAGVGLRQHLERLPHA